jgi:hypothetical protein
MTSKNIKGRNHRVSYGAGTSKATSGGVKRLIFTNTGKTSLFNTYVAGSNVGALNSSVRRALNRRAMPCNNCNF